MSDIGTTALAIGTLIGSAVTAVATFMLWRVTAVLAAETRRMAEAGSQPHVVVTVEPSRWSFMHAEVHIENSGNSPAYEITVQFDPEPQNAEVRKERGVPFQRVSVLKPGQAMRSYLSEFAPLVDTTFKLTISWLRQPGGVTRETISYDLDLSVYKNVTMLGSSDPMVQIADQVKKIREDWQRVPGGSKKLSVDVFSAFDRLREQRAHMRRYREAKRREEGRG